MSHYQTMIADILTDSGRTADPRLVEAFMRAEFGTLDALDPDEFAAEVRDAADMVRDHRGTAELLADALGL